MTNKKPDLGEKVSWSGFSNADTKLLLITTHWETLLWFYRNLLGAKQLAPFVEDGGKPVYVVLEMGGIFLTLIEAQYAAKISGGYLAATGISSVVMEFTADSEKQLKEIVKVASEYGIGTLFREIKYGVGEKPALMAIDPDGNQLIITS